MSLGGFSREFDRYIDRGDIVLELKGVFNDKKKARERARKLKNRKRIKKYRIIEKKVESVFKKRDKFGLYVY